MNRFDHVNPLAFRYLPNDPELASKVRECTEGDPFLKTKWISREMVVPRLHALEDRLHMVVNEQGNRQIQRRIDSICVGTISVGGVFTDYARRLVSRVQDFEQLSSDVEDLQRYDHLSDIIYHAVSTFSVEANIANDIRHLFRSEIEEAAHKEFAKERVGSSTMPHKRNPVEYEQIISLWKAYLPTVTSAILCQIREHQEDATNEQLPHQAFELVCCLAYTTKRLELALNNLDIKSCSKDQQA